MATASLALSTLSLNGYSLHLPKEILYIILFALVLTSLGFIIDFIRGFFK